ncbi:MAG TPA: AAA family ATPase [Patescibacteria group bacterium]|nr:AAA family ATPase [Patescibacteria group bacterium]
MDGNYKYKNVTISGLPGGGSTTLLKLLREHLEFDGWRGFSGGEFMRAYALEKGIFHEKGALHHSAADYEEDFDRKIDMGMREKVQNEEKWILESWLSGFMAQGVPDVLKILVVCSDDAIRIDRIVNRDGATVEDVKANITKRYTDNNAKWTRMYKKQWQEWVVDRGLAKPDDPIDFWRPNLYDVCIDTYSTNKEQTFEAVLGHLQNG